MRMRYRHVFAFGSLSILALIQQGASADDNNKKKAQADSQRETVAKPLSEKQ